MRLMRPVALLLFCSSAAGFASVGISFQCTEPGLLQPFPFPTDSNQFVHQTPSRLRSSILTPFAHFRRNLRRSWIPQGLRSVYAGEDQTIKTALDSRCNVLVVGANRGIGLEFVRQVLKKGCYVVATYRGKASKELQELKGDRLHLVECDITKQESAFAAAADAKRHVRSGLTHIIHSAGVSQLDEDSELNFDLVSAEEMLNVFKINCVGPLFMIQSFLPLCAPPVGSRVPVIAFLSSKVASIGDNQSGGLYAYRTSKAALNQIAKNFYIDLKGIAAVLLLHPGYVRTQMTDYVGFIDPPESVDGMLRAVQATDANTPFRWVDYAGDPIDW